MNRLTTFLSLFFLSFTALNARPQFVSRVPNGDAASRPDSGITCAHLGHEPCLPGAPRNSFGLAFEANGFKWDKTLCEDDSDDDGLTNGEELGDPCCEWSADNPTPLRQVQLSHPGLASEDGAKAAPKCQSAPPATTTATTTTATTTTATSTTTTTATTATTSPSQNPAPQESSPSPDASPSEAAESSPASSPTDVATPAPTIIPNPDDDNVCFPAHAQVRLENGLEKRMDQVEIGDSVHVGNGRYSDVFMFTHKIPQITHDFVTIHVGTADKREASVTLTRGHYIYVNNKAITADQVKVGDMLELYDGRKTPVVSIECAKFRGLYNPQTTHGDLVVDGVKVSTYTTAVQSKMAHSLLAPLRAIYRWFGWSPLSLERGASRFAKLLP